MKTKLFILLFLGAISFILLAACSKPQVSDIESPAISFSTDVAPILNQRCISCHGGSVPSAGLDLSSYEGIMAGAKGRPVLIAGDASKSNLVVFVESGKMPRNGEKLTSDQIKILTNWVDQGALDN